MHPCGAYRYNSLFHILDAERKASKAILTLQRSQEVASNQHLLGGKEDLNQAEEEEALHIVHRLDRLTSGLTLFAKNPEVCEI